MKLLLLPGRRLGFLVAGDQMGCVTDNVQNSSRKDRGRPRGREIRYWLGASVAGRSSLSFPGGNMWKVEPLTNQMLHLRDTAGLGKGW